MVTRRPSLYSDELATTVCDKIANVQSLRSICNGKDIPNTSTIMCWLKEKTEFQDQ